MFKLHWILYAHTLLYKKMYKLAESEEIEKNFQTWMHGLIENQRYALILSGTYASIFDMRL